MVDSVCIHKFKIVEEATLWTEEKLATLIENIITRALGEQQKNLFNIISGNFEISKQQISERFRRQGSTRRREFRTH